MKGYTLKLDYKKGEQQNHILKGYTTFLFAFSLRLELPFLTIDL